MDRLALETEGAGREVQSSLQFGQELDECAIAAGGTRRPFRGGRVLTPHCLDRVPCRLLIAGAVARPRHVTLGIDQPGKGATCLGRFSSQV